jgi:hypothetical protein
MCVCLGRSWAAVSEKTQFYVFDTATRRNQVRTYIKPSGLYA